MIEPPLVLMDEPLSNLDASLRLEMRTEIRRLHQELGLTTVYVTHDQEEALSLADRLVILREGVVQQIGTPDQLYRSPVNSYVAGFMGYRNIFPADAMAVRGGMAAVTGGGLNITGTTVGQVSQGPVTVAIRPEDISVVANGSTEENALPVKVEVVEYHGREFSVEARLTGGSPLRLRTNERVAPGEIVTVRVPAEQALVFPGSAQGSPSGGGQP